MVPATGQGALRASHADRDQVAEVLRVAAGDGRLSPEELDERLELALSARTYDELAASVNEYASPSVSFDLQVKIFQERKFIIIRVHEFAEIPILCRKEYHPTNIKKAAPILRRGACYVRSRHKPETSEIPSEEEMRELLELAIDKGVRRFLTRAQKAGLFPPIQTSPLLPGDEELFKNQIEDLG